MKPAKAGFRVSEATIARTGHARRPGFDASARGHFYSLYLSAWQVKETAIPFTYQRARVVAQYK